MGGVEEEEEDFEAKQKKFFGDFFF